MENSIQQIEIPVSVDELDAMEASMQNKVERSLRASNFKCSIYKVPEFIRKGNEEYYRPSVISIGPVFYNDQQLQTMQQLKWIYLDSFLKSEETADRSLKHYISIVRETIGEIKECYEDPSMISCSNDDEFVEMIVIDAIFLLCLFTRLVADFRAPTKLEALLHFVNRDIFVLENQIPYFVIRRIFDEAFPALRNSLSLIEFTRSFISNRNLPGGKSEPIASASLASDDIGHLLDFWWKTCSLSFEKNREKQKQVDITGNEAEPLQLPETAKQLSAAGVTFKKDESTNPLWITFTNSNGEFHLPKFKVTDKTEYVIRNILIFESCHCRPCNDHTYITDWVSLLNALIQNVQDIQILEQAEILENQIGSDEALLEFFKKIGKNVIYSSYSFNYSKVCQEVNRYANKPWNRWKAILRRDYFNHPWAIISFIFAVILFILTVIQTITGFKKN